ncbi:glutamate racemase [Deinococcus sp. MIMF12]|uniref:Glutamate racemase n=1 Tax=Deinococcus rhizophilus TaxID=3049544 RepID=A0ABT7JGL9_9DEIO|nr:glutamate racemase [Deinococcus rhizophilus]MDL2344185.1 glutamate racemase [Deinococcus rhizophilus]
MTPPTPSEAPLGVFDSGVGGLSVLAELRRAMPGKDFLYLADTAHVPIGARPDEEIRDLTARAVAALHARRAGGVVVACNTASAFSLTHLRERYGPDFPVIGLVPAVKPAVAATRTGVVGVLATPGTLRGTLLKDVIARFAEPAGVQVLTAVSAELVPLVEAGQARGERARAVLREVLAPLAGAGADQLVLGCTHYPFLAPSIRAEFGDTFALVDSGTAVARHTRNVLAGLGRLRQDAGGGHVTYLVTGDPAASRPVITTLTGEDGHNVTVQQVTT